MLSMVSLVPSPSSSANKLLFGDGIQLDINNCSSSDVVADIRITENPILNVNVTNPINAWFSLPNHEVQTFGLVFPYGN